MIDLLFAFLCGLVAHQSERFVDDFVSPLDEFARYTVGVLAIIVSFTVTLRRLNSHVQRDGLLALLIAATGTGAGVVTAHFLDRVKVE